MDLLTIFFPGARAAQAAKEAAEQLTEHQQTERLKALAALRQMPLDEQTRARVEEAFQSELAKLLPPPPVVLFKGSEKWQRIAAWSERKAGWIILITLAFLLIISGLSQCTSK